MVYIPRTQLRSPQQVQQPQQSGQFQPIYGAEQTRALIKRASEFRGSLPKSLQKKLEEHANYHNIPFYTGEFNPSEAIMQLAKGMFSGFTTFNVGSAPDNEYEAIARSVGHLIGFAPGMVAAPVGRLARMAGMAGMAGWAQKMSGIKSIPMLGAQAIRKRVEKISSPMIKKAAEGKAGAVNTVASFLNKGAARHVAEGAFDLGVASGLSSWQGGVNAMLEGTFHGALAGGVFRTLGNAIKLGDPKATKLTRGLAGSLFQGLSAEARGATTPEKVYEYLLGGFFGLNEVPWQKAGAMKFMKDFGAKSVKNAEMDIKKDPKLMGEKWDKLDPEIKEQVYKEIDKLYPNNVGGFMGHEIIKQLGLQDKYGNITKESWEKAREIMKTGEISQEHANYLAEEPLVEPAQERIVKKIFKVQEDIDKSAEKIKSLQEAFDVENKIFKDTGKKSAMYLYTSEKIGELSNEIVKKTELKEQLELGIKPEDIVSKVGENQDNASDPGEIVSDIRVGNRAQQFADKWLKDLFELPEVDMVTKNDLRTLISAKVDKQLIKNIEPGKEPNTEKMANELQKELGAPLSAEARGELRQWLNIANNGQKQPHMRLMYSVGKKGKEYFRIEPMAENMTKAGNKKDSQEPMKVLEEIYLKESGGEIDTKYGNMTTVDHISMKNSSGHWKDYKLSDLRKASPEVYDATIQKLVKNMNKKNVGMYLFGGRGDADKLFFVKYHPKTKSNKLGPTLNRLIGPKGNRKANYKKALTLFREQFPNLTKAESRKMFDDAFISNILYDMGMQGYDLTPANLKKMWGPKDITGFISNTLDYNKRLQIMLTPAWAGSKEFAKVEFAKDKVFKKHGGFRYSVVKDIEKLKEHDEKLFKAYADSFLEKTDGAIIARDDVVKFNNKDAGQPESGQNKAFILSPDGELGGMYGKFMFHDAGKKLSEAMKKEGLHYLIYESSTKQLGKRNVGTYDISPRGKFSLNADKYTLDPSHIKYSYSVKQHDNMWKHNHRIPKQWFSNLNSKVAYKPIDNEVITDIFNETIAKSYQGETKWNDALANYRKNPTKEGLNKLIKNIDKIGVNELLEAANTNEGTEFSDAAFRKLLKINKEAAYEEARENGHKETELNEYIQELEDFNTMTDRILNQANKVAKQADIKAAAIYTHKWIRPYRLKVMRSYIMNQIAKPKIGNSAAARMRPYDKAMMMDLDKSNPYLKELNTRDDIFFLDNKYYDMPIITHLPGKFKKTTLGKLWEASVNDKGKVDYSKNFKGLEKEVEEIFRAMAIRVPMDSISGAHALKFRGFTGRNGHGILLHPRSMRALGGADLDADEAFVYFGGKNAAGVGEGMKKTWKDVFEANKEEYVQYVTKKKIGGKYKYKTPEEFKKLSAKQKEAYDKFIPDPKSGQVNRPDGKHKGQSMEDLLTEGASEFSKLAKKSQIYMYAPSSRLKVSQDVVDSRAQMGGVVSMTQTMKAAHDLIANKKGKVDTFNFDNKEGKKWETYQVEIEARTEKEWLDYARRLTSSMTAFTADPMDSGGIKPYQFYFKELYDSYFKVKNVKKFVNNRLVDAKIKDLDGFMSKFANKKFDPIWKLKNGTLENVMKMNTSLFGQNYKAGRMWTESEIKENTQFINEFDSNTQLTNIMAKQARLINKSPKWVDNIFNKIDKSKLEQLYVDMNQMAKDYKFLAGMMGRTTFTIPESQFVKKILDFRAFSDRQRRNIANDSLEFFDFMKGLNYTRHKKDTPEKFKKDMEDFSVQEREAIVNDVWIKAQDFVTNDIHQMVSLKRIADLYEKNKDVLDMKTIERIFTEVEDVKKSSYLMAKERMELGDLDAIRDHHTPEEIAAYKLLLEKDYKLTEGSSSLDQVQVDKRIKQFKDGLETNAEKKLYDYLMLGSYNRNEMAKRGNVNLKDPKIKHDYMMKGSKSSLTKLGYTSTSISDTSIRDYLRDYMGLAGKSFKAKESEIKKAIKALDKAEEVKVEVDGQDGKVRLFEPENIDKELVKNSYVEDLSGYEGLTAGKLNPEQTKIVTELAENLKYYSKGHTLKLNEITRDVMKKDMNVMDLQDWKIFNNFLKDMRAGTFQQRLFKEDSPDMKKRFWMMFPKTVSKSMMKYDIEFVKKKGFFKTKSGEWKEGWVRQPSWALEGLQDWNGRIGEKAIELGEKLNIELNSVLSFYTDAVPEYGETLRRIAVRKMELSEIPRIFRNKDISLDRRRQQARSYRDEYIKSIEGSSNQVRTANPKGSAKIALERIYNITNPDGTKVKMNGWEIVDKIKETYTNMNKRAHEMMVGKPEALDRYKTGKFFDFEQKEPEINWRLFVKDLEARYREGKDFPLDLGIDGVRQIARSMLLEFFPKNKAGNKARAKLMKTRLTKTGKLNYSGYYPHMFHSKAESRKAMEAAIRSVKEDPNLTEEARDAQIKEILMKGHNISGDWIEPGTEIWDAFERAAGEINSKKKGDELKWWNANQRMGSMHSRTNHMPGYDISKNTYEVYLRNIANTYFNQINQIFSRHKIEQFRKRGEELGWHKEKTGTYINEDGVKVQSNLLRNWMNFLKLYAQDAMGNPAIIPERIYNDPSMKLKGTPYYWWADNRVKKKLQGMKDTILGKKASEYPELDKHLNEIDYSTLQKISNAEAKFELASLLAHPKASVGNIFGGSIHSIQSAGLEYFKKGRDISYLNKINPKWKSKDDIDAFVTKHGVIPEFILYQFGIDPDMRAANVKNFAKDIAKKIGNDGELAETTLRDLGKKHNVSEGIMNIASKFMSVPERMLRRDAFMAHYARAYEMFDGAIKNPDHPFLIELAKKGVKATQFLYNAPYRPAFARTALGKIMTRFQLWQWNAVRFRNDIAREAKIFGLRAGTPEYERFRRLMQADLTVFALGNAFAYSIFDTAMPAPYSWFQDTADWLFGNENERDRAFFGMWPKGLAPLQLVTPPIMRHPLSVMKSLNSGEWDRFANYHIYTLFPFGRLAKDFLAPNNLIENPMGLVDKWAGFPLQSLNNESKKMRKGKGPWYPWSPYGVER